MRFHSLNSIAWECTYELHRARTLNESRVGMYEPCRARINLMHWIGMDESHQAHLNVGGDVCILLGLHKYDTLGVNICIPSGPYI